MITQEELKELVDYDPLTGVFTAKVPLARNTFVGKVLGCKGPKSLIIILNGKQYKAHRLAFLFMTGTVPPIVAHLNKDNYDNRWENLKESTVKESHSDLKVYSNNRSGIKGITLTDRGTYVYRKNGRYLGSYKTLEEAKKAKAEAENK